MIDWMRKWQFTLSLSLALLIPFLIWAIKALMWSWFQQSWDLSGAGYGLLTMAVVVLLIIALATIVRRPVQKKPWKKARHYALLITTLALNVICWSVIWVMSTQGFT